MSEHYGLWSKHVGWWAWLGGDAGGGFTPTPRLMFSTPNRGVPVAQLKELWEDLPCPYAVRRFGPDGKPEEET